MVKWYHTMDDTAALRFEARMDTVEKQGVELNHRVGAVEGQLRNLTVKVDSVAGQLNSILQAVTKQEATPKVDLVKLLVVTKDLAILVGLAATLLGFIINSYGAEKRAVLEWRLGQMEKHMERNVLVQAKSDKVQP